MKILSKGKEFHIAWEYLAAPLLIILALVILIAYPVTTQKDDTVSIAANVASSTPVEQMPERVAASTQVPYEAADKEKDSRLETENTNAILNPVGQKININKAGMDELLSLPYIGEVKAKAIIDYRLANGPFNTIEELLNVKGIGPKTLERLRDFATVEK